MTKRWTLLSQPVRGEHSLWRKAGDSDGTVYIADCSGRNPDNTEDGPLRLTGSLRLQKDGRLGVVANVRVMDESGSPRGVVLMHPVVAAWLVEHEGFDAVVSDVDLLAAGRLLGAALQ